MTFKKKYIIKQQFLPTGTKRRPGTPALPIKFITLHDTGNPDSTAVGNVKYYTNSANEMSASAHIFVDGTDIIECIPAFTKPEKAWHVVYNATVDNQMFGDDANDISIGVELCWGPKINNTEAYKKYVWVVAYLCYVHGISPNKVAGHHILDPQRKIDPKNGLEKTGKTYAGLLEDIKKEYASCIEEEPVLLKQGARGTEVKDLQSNLNKLGFNVGTVDGIFGLATSNQVKAFQAKYALKVDGIAGDSTLAAIEKILASNTPVPVKQTVTPSPIPVKLYRVVVGSFGSKENAEKMVGELKSKGYPAIIRYE
jgi:N-acetylmuramoyl-L-alanine amidase